MPISNSTYSRGRPSKVKGREEQARRNKERRQQLDKLTIRFSRNFLEIEKTKSIF